MTSNSRAAIATIARYAAGIKGRFLFFLPSIFENGINVGLGAATVILAINQIIRHKFSSLKLIDLYIVPLTAIALIQLLIFLWEAVWITRFDMYIRNDDEKMQNEIIMKYKNNNEYECLEFNKQALVFQKNVWPLINDATNIIEIKKGKYKLPKSIDTIKMQLLALAPNCEWDTFNDAKIRTTSSLKKVIFQKNDEISLQKTCYYYDRITNNIALKTIFMDGLEYIPIHRWVTDEKGCLVSLDRSRLSNQIGGSTLLITSDRKIVYVAQGNRSDENKNKLAPTGSGSFDWNDIRINSNEKLSFQTLAKRSIFRELTEEVGISIKEDDSFHHLVGIGRYLYRGGKPEIFSIVCANVRLESLAVRASEWDLVHKQILHFDIEDLDENSLIKGFIEFVKLLESQDYNVSGPLYFNAKLVLDAFDLGLAKKIADWFAACTAEDR